MTKEIKTLVTKLIRTVPITHVGSPKISPETGHTGGMRASRIRKISQTQGLWAGSSYGSLKAG